MKHHWYQSLCNRSRSPLARELRRLPASVRIVIEVRADGPAAMKCVSKGVKRR